MTVLESLSKVKLKKVVTCSPYKKAKTDISLSLSLSLSLSFSLSLSLSHTHTHTHTHTNNKKQNNKQIISFFGCYRQISK